MTISEPVSQQPKVQHQSNGHEVKDEKNAYVEVPEQGNAMEKPLNPWQKFSKKMFRMEMLLVWTVIGVVCGISLGAGLYSLKLSRTAIALIGYPGELMIRALQELILPLMVFALMSGVFALRATKTGSGKVTRWALTYYILSMFIAIIIGIACVFTINPGKSRPFENPGSSASCAAENTAAVQDANDTASKTTVDSLLDLGRDLIPTNIVGAAAEPNYLGVMVFAVTFAVFLVKIGERAEPLMKGIEICNDVVIKIIFLVILITPIGIASWIATTILKACSITHLLKSLGLFVVTVLTSIAIHFFIALPLTLLVLSRTNPFKAFKSWLPAFAMALGTSSSAATMPVSMECGIRHGCNPAIVNFVLPLGTNINRDGTALYEAIAVIFIVQATGNAKYLADLSLLYAVDWILGMFRTICNVWGDACATVVVNSWLIKYGKDVEVSALENPEDAKLEEGTLAQKESLVHGARHAD